MRALVTPFVNPAVPPETPWLVEQQSLFAKIAPAAKQSADPNQLCDTYMDP